jgi:IS30 family transposase
MKHLTMGQRYEISSYKEAGKSIVEIASLLNVSPTTIRRELKRNSDQRNGEYHPDLAQRKTAKRHKEKAKRQDFTSAIAMLVRAYLIKDYSPEQIVGVLKLEGISCVSHERIYQYIWRDKAKGGSLYTHLRSQGKRYTSRGLKYKKRGTIPKRVDISERPAIVAKKERVGDLEIDLIVGANHKGFLLTINDRVTGILKMKLLHSKEATHVEQAVIEILGNDVGKIHTITSDNGKEFANHQSIAEKLQIGYYFATPYHSWERGANENLNGLVRQYFPKRTSFENLTDPDIDVVVEKLNNRPRKRFNFKSPSQMEQMYKDIVA